MRLASPQESKRYFQYKGKSALSTHGIHMEGLVAERSVSGADFR